ncbi:MAG: hypothetical protein WB779_10905 [Ignavibacteriaceae bacterium]|jgi:hypothetical protein
MQKVTKKYRKRCGKLFLSIYSLFVLVGIFHFHPYNIDQLTAFTNSATTNSVTDLTLDDFFSICSLHQFAQSIDNFHYSSSNIIQSLAQLESRLNLPGINDFTSLKYSHISLRAPPISS